MQPYDNPKVRRKDLRETLKGIARGRRTTHRVKTQDPIPGSSWMRRHPGEWPPHILRHFGGA